MTLSNVHEPVPVRLNIPEAGSFIWSSVFSPRFADGNQTLVIRLQTWPDLERIRPFIRGLERLETTLFVLDGNRLQIRWFAGSHEVPLCGHAALAANDALLPHLKDGELLEVENLQGRLWLSRQGDSPYIVFRRASLTEVPPETFDVGARVARAFDAGRDYLLILENEEAVRSFDPRHAGLERLSKIGCIISGPCPSGAACFRFFAPRVGIHEDRASGSVIPALMEYWVSGKPGDHIFLQESGHDIRIRARWLDERIAITGEVVEFARGRIPELFGSHELR